MYSFIAENENGDQIQLTQNPNYDLEITKGLLPPSATINTSRLVNADGEVFNSSSMNMRNLVLMIYPKVPIEENRIALYKIFQSKKYVKCYYKNSKRNVYIEGYVETIDGSLFDQIQVIQVSIICPQPFWLGLNELTTDVSKTTNMLEFPFWTDGEPYTYDGDDLLVYANGTNVDRSKYYYFSDNITLIQAEKIVSGGAFFARFTAYLQAGYTYQLNYDSNMTVTFYMYGDDLWGSDRILNGAHEGSTFTVDFDGTYVIGLYLSGAADQIVSVTNPEIVVVSPSPSPVIVSEGIPFSEYNQLDVATIVNNGEVKTGMIIDIRFTSDTTVVNPKIYNANTGEFFGLTGTFSGGENYIYRIDSVKKTVQQIYNNKVSTNLLNFITENSSWLMIENGTNMFYYTDDSGTDDMYLQISFAEKYEGV